MLLGVFQPKSAAASASCWQMPSSAKADTALSRSAGVSEATTIQVLYGCATMRTLLVKALALTTTAGTRVTTSQITCCVKCKAAGEFAACCCLYDTLPGCSHATYTSTLQRHNLRTHTPVQRRRSGASGTLPEYHVVFDCCFACLCNQTPIDNTLALLGGSTLRFSHCSASSSLCML